MRMILNFLLNLFVFCIFCNCAINCIASERNLLFATFCTDKFSVPRIADLVLPEEKLIRAEFINSVVNFNAFRGDFNFHSHMRMNFCFVAFKVFLLTCEPLCFFGNKN